MIGADVQITEVHKSMGDGLLIPFCALDREHFPVAGFCVIQVALESTDVAQVAEVVELARKIARRRRLVGRAQVHRHHRSALHRVLTGRILIRRHEVDDRSLHAGRLRRAGCRHPAGRRLDDADEIVGRGLRHVGIALAGRRRQRWLGGFELRGLKS